MQKWHQIEGLFYVVSSLMDTSTFRKNRQIDINSGLNSGTMYMKIEVDSNAMGVAS